MLKTFECIQARIVQLVAYRLGTGEVPGSNPGNGKNFSMKLSNWLNLNLNTAILDMVDVLAEGCVSLMIDKQYMKQDFQLAETF